MENAPLPRRNKTETNPHGEPAAVAQESSHDEDRNPLLLLTVRIIYLEMYLIAFILGVLPTRLLSFLGATKGFDTPAGLYILQFTASYCLGLALVLSAVAQCESKVQRKVLQYLQGMFWLLVYVGSKSSQYVSPWASNLLLGSAALQSVLLLAVLYACNTKPLKRD